MESLAQLEQLCERLYKSQDPAERAHAEQTLHCFSVNPEYISQCQFILDNSQSPYAQLLASSSLVKLVTDQNHPIQLRLDIRNYVLNYLASSGPKLLPFVTTSLIQLLSRLTKLGWHDHESHRDIVRECTKFLAQGTVEHFYIGLKVLNQLVAEMNQTNPGRSLTHHRKTACSFRDLALFQTFQISLTSLRQLQNDLAHFQSSQMSFSLRQNEVAEDKLREQAIELALKCLSFDFVGTSLDEGSEDLGTIQIPSSWRPLLEDTSTMQLFFDYYAATNPPLSTRALECLVRLASVRRSLFGGEKERTKFLSHLMSGTGKILANNQGLGEYANYNEFCRLLGRLKTNYQLSELVSVENYADWIRLVEEFTIKSLRSWQWASGSVYYLLGLWSRLVLSMPYLKSDSPSLLDTCVPKITEAYITSRLDAVRAVIQNANLEDPLDNEEQLQDQLDSLPSLCRFQYETTSNYIIELFKPLLQSYTEATRMQSGGETVQLSVMEGQLTWLVHIIGSVIKGRLSSSSAESQEVLDAELASRVFQLIQVTDTGLHSQRYHEKSKQRLDAAILSFFQNFRKAYVGEQAMHSSKQLYARLTELVGLQDHLMVLNVTVGKIATNLKCYTQCEEVIEATLNLFQDLASGYMSGKLLLKLDAVNFILAHHTREYFPFLSECACSRNRTTFYFTLGRLLFMEDSPAKFKAFIAPLQQVLVSLKETPDSMFRSKAVEYTLIGLMRDLRGIAMSTNSRRTYGLLFDWLYPEHTPLLLRAVEHWTDTPAVTTPLLKFMAEFVVNKMQRLTFDSSSPNGILLFREVSRLIVAFGTRVLALPNGSDPYASKYKGIWIALTILTRALAGNYVNFGVFELYGDRALADALDVALKISLSISLQEIMAFRKLARAYFALLDVLCHNHTTVIVNLDANTFARIVSSLEAGIKSLDVSISSEILKTLFEMVLFEECTNQWALSRPMLSLILINEQIFSTLSGQIISAQMPRTQLGIISY
ncbi:hypothetical protein CBR_g30950 [Chara braunii]|uniref:Importin N-terminal domain-containing protein n=1 Tax=Chara braunii TaxID=69332 RepID=A0A388LDV9_CHABU|nr:hypothetical protein CBR_g30950 [Chara braunii]|eukprot:GBG80488.1 hypothetical protein CBR_g30950 [Chara braunii]